MLPDCCDGISSTGSENAQSDIGKEFTAEFNNGCAKQARCEEVLVDIIARIAAGEKAMIVFCGDHDVTDFAAFKLGALNGKLVVEDYD